MKGVVIGILLGTNDLSNLPHVRYIDGLEKTLSPVFWEEIARVEVDDVATFFHLRLHRVAQLSHTTYARDRHVRTARAKVDGRTAKKRAVMRFVGTGAVAF